MEREKIIAQISSHITIPSQHVAAMKASLNMPWNQLRQMSRWLKTFKIKITSEKKTRAAVTEWVGPGLQVELAPLTKKSTSGKHLQVILRPWAYLYNLVAHVIKRFDDIKASNQQIIHSFITPGEVHVKIGGDHGGNSFKMCYQIANIKNPNRKENTVVFSLFEAKDSRSNLRVCLARFQPQVNMLQSVKWENNSVRVFMYGDYEFLSAMYGISGANGKTSKLFKSQGIQYNKINKTIKIAKNIIPQTFILS